MKLLGTTTLYLSALISVNALSASSNLDSTGRLEVDPSAQCKALESADFSGVQDAPTQITEAKAIEPSDGRPAYCRVQGYVSPQVGFEIRLPTSGWNGKFMATGCGGACGSIPIEWLCPEPLRKGYACIASDMGHKDAKGGGLWAYNNLQAEIDWGYRATHVTAVAGKAITAQYYDKPPQKSYFMGCSTGGRQGMVEAQRFPWDFDGIIAGAPASDQSGAIMTRLWAALAIRGEDGKPVLGSADLQLVHTAVVAECDMNDGIKDGVIGDPRICKFDPDELVCKAASSAECLTRLQANALKKIYAGPLTPEGKEIYADGALMPGAELAFGSFYRSEDFSVLDVDFFRYMAFIPDAGPSWQPTDINFERDSRRFAMMESIYAGNNPDLREFKARGGKLILYHGWSDAGAGGIPPLKSVDYYETVEKTMGGPEATKEFFRLFMIPGMGHCGGGEGAWTIDFVSYLEDWVERGQAPDKIIGAHMKADGSTGAVKFPLDPAKIEFSRPVYPYPLIAKYLGSGDPKDASSFGPVLEKRARLRH